MQSSRQRTRFRVCAAHENGLPGLVEARRFFVPPQGMRPFPVFPSMCVMRYRMRSRPRPFSLNAVPALQLPLFSSYIRAGFPNPADDHFERGLTVSDIIVSNPLATFLLQVDGESMIGAGIYPGDYVVVDRSLEVRHRDVVVAEVDGEFTIKRFLRHNGTIQLAPENPAFRPLIFTAEMEVELTIFGVVIANLHMHRPRRRGR